MPFMKNGKRDYQKEKKWDHANGRLKDRAERNAARAQLMKEGKVKKGDGKDVDHKRPLSKGGSNSRSNLRVRSASANRSFARKKDGSMK
jgi:hypothetical protein